MIRSFLAIAVAACLISCESKFHEPAAEKYDGGSNAESRLDMQNQLDERVQTIQLNVSQIQQLIQTVTNLLKSQNLRKLSVFDFVYEINNEIQSKLPQFKGEKVFVTGEHTLKVDFLSKNCQVFPFQLEGSAEDQFANIQYGLKSCHHQDSYLPVVTAQFEGKKLRVRFTDENLRTVLPVKKLLSKVSECQFAETKDEPTVCSNIIFAESKALIWVLSLKSQGSTEVQIQALDKQDDFTVYQGYFEVTEKGKIEKFKVEGPFARK